MCYYAFTLDSHVIHSLEPPLHGHSADVPPAAVQAACGLLYGVTLRLCGAGITVVQQNLTQVQHRRHTCAVLLNVPLQILQGNTDVNFFQ